MVMHSLLVKCLPCSVCGQVAFLHDGWFLLSQDRWFDRLRILSWNFSLASGRDIKSACCRDHLRILVAHWLEQASLRLPQSHILTAPTATPSRPNNLRESRSAGHFLAELSVCRDSRSRNWTGSPAALEYILEALAPQPAEDTSCALNVSLAASTSESAPGLSLHQVAGKAAIRSD